LSRLHSLRGLRDLYSFPTRRSSDLGSLMANNYYSGDGTQGATSTVNSMVFKDGLYTSGTFTIPTTIPYDSVTGAPTTLPWDSLTDRKSTRLNSSHVKRS